MEKKKKNKVLAWLIPVVVIVIIIALIAVFSVQKPKEEKVIKIGAILPLTGKVSYWGEPVLKGMNFAIQEINSKGGINGKKLKLIVEDSKADPKEGVTAANKLISEGVITMIVHTTAVSNAVAPILEENKIPWIADAADPGLPLTYSYAFKTFYNAYAECKKLASYGLEKGIINTVCCCQICLGANGVQRELKK